LQFCIRLSGVPISETLALSITIILSQLSTDSILCATNKIVEEWNIFLIVCWISVSVLWSILAVASSRHNIFALLSNARTKHSSCLWPLLKSLPLSLMFALKPPRLRTNDSKWHSLRESHISLSERWLLGSRLSLIVPLNKKGSWGIMNMCDLSRYITHPFILYLSLQLTTKYVIRIYMHLFFFKVMLFKYLLLSHDFKLKTNIFFPFN